MGIAELRIYSIFDQSRVRVAHLQILLKHLLFYKMRDLLQLQLDSLREVFADVRSAT
jgi:hypothetical protein